MIAFCPRVLKGGSRRGTRGKTESDTEIEGITSSACSSDHDRYHDCLEQGQKAGKGPKAERVKSQRLFFFFWISLGLLV
jgi:hypothetical protein